MICTPNCLLHPPDCKRALLLLGLLVTACPSPAHQVQPEWQTISVDYGQGHYRLPVRYHWVTARASNGIEISSVDGGKATLRLFACTESVPQIQSRIRRQLRERFIGSAFSEPADQEDREGVSNVFTFSWRHGPTMTGKVMFTAVSRHGPLLIAVTSSTMQPDDVARVAGGTRLDLPLPTIQSCLPVCLPKSKECELAE